MLAEEPEGVVPLYIGKAETIGNFLLRLARLGGYQNRTRDTPPGNMVLWRGMARLTDIHFGYCLAKDVGNRKLYRTDKIKHRSRNQTPETMLV